MNGLTFILVFLITAISIFFAVKEKKGGVRKPPSSKKSNLSKPKRLFWSESLKEIIRWSIFLLICLILLLVVVKFVFSSFDGNASRIATEISRVTNNSDTTFLEIKKVYYGTNFGNKISPYLDHPYNSEYDFRGATQDYCIKNKYNRIVCAKKGTDAEPEMVKYSNGNLYFQIRSTSGRSGYIFVRIYRVD